MRNSESLVDFYKNKFNEVPDNLQKSVGHFNVFRLEDCLSQEGSPILYTRRDFYKILLIRGHNRYHYADKSIEVDGSTLMFFNPQLPYTWEAVTKDATGYFCIFTEAFFTEKFKSKPEDYPMFAYSGKPTYILSPQQDVEVASIFQKMLEEIQSEYVYKYDLLRNYIAEVVHYALKRNPSETMYQHPDANSRITAVFTELLERQFPIETPAQRLGLRSAKDFAASLSIHVNHLNRAIRITTGKTTTSLISDRITNEAKALLKHTDWNVSEIAYCLGFEEPAHFNNFFKKQTALSPGSFRNV